jgi:hypothetical protein
MYLTLDPFGKSQNLRMFCDLCGDKLKARRIVAENKNYTERERESYVQDLRVCSLVKRGPIRRMQFWAPSFSSMIYA